MRRAGTQQRVARGTRAPPWPSTTHWLPAGIGWVEGVARSIQPREGRIVAVKVLVRPPPRKDAPNLPPNACKQACISGSDTGFQPSVLENPQERERGPFRADPRAFHSVRTPICNPFAGRWLSVPRFDLSLLPSCTAFHRGYGGAWATGAAASRRGAGAAVDSQPRTHPLGRARRGSGCARSFFGFIGSTSTTRWAERSNTTPHMCVRLVPCCTGST